LEDSRQNVRQQPRPRRSIARRCPSLSCIAAFMCMEDWSNLSTYQLEIEASVTHSDMCASSRARAASIAQGCPALSSIAWQDQA